ncbi:hypothetical protein [Sphingomonas panacisoli]|nr:hypothetical protein [Sphingomonas panacisoli]
MGEGEEIDAALARLIELIDQEFLKSGTADQTVIEQCAADLSEFFRQEKNGGPLATPERHQQLQRIMLRLFLSYDLPEPVEGQPAPTELELAEWRRRMSKIDDEATRRYAPRDQSKKSS